MDICTRGTLQHRRFLFGLVDFSKDKTAAMEEPVTKCIQVQKMKSEEGKLA